MTLSDVLGSILSPALRCMYCGEVATIIDDPFSLCDSCELMLITDLRKSGFPSVSASSEDVNAAAIEISPPNPSVAAATISESALELARAAGTATASDLTDPPVAVAVNNFDFETEVSALEANGFAYPELPAFLDRRNSSTFRVTAASDSRPASLSST